MVEEESILHNHTVFGETQLAQNVFVDTSFALRRELFSIIHRSSVWTNSILPIIVMKTPPIDLSCTTTVLWEWHDSCGKSMSFVNSASICKDWPKGELTLLTRVVDSLELWFIELRFNRRRRPKNGSAWW